MIISHMYKMWAFIRREFLFQWSYKFGFLYEIGSLFSSLVVLYFVSSMFGDSPPQSISKYNTDYFTFALIGWAFLDYMWVSMRTYALHIRVAQIIGTLEAMFVTPTHPFAIILHSSAYTYLWTTLRSLLYITVGVGLFGAQMPNVNLLSVILFVALILLAFSGIGIASAALTLYTKQSDPITSFIGGVSFLFGGVVYPVDTLPPFLQKVAWVLPMTHAVEGLRMALLFGASPFDLMDHILILLLWSFLIYPSAFLLLKKVLNVLSKEGSFGAY